MNLRLLKTFTTVVDQHSFSKAATVLGMSQPAVSKAVRELETQLETVLLERRGRSFAVTEAGQTLYEFGRGIAALEREADEAVGAFHGLTRGTLIIGASTTIATYWLPAYLVAFHQKYPGIEVHLHSANSQHIIERLLDCELDVALVEGQVVDDRVEARPWLEEEMVVVAASDTAPQTLGEPAAFTEQLWVVREPGSGSREATERLLTRLGNEHPKTLEVGSNEAIVQTVAAGCGLGLVPKVCAQDQLALGRVRIVPLSNDPILRKLYRVRLPHRPTSHAALAFEALLADTTR
ncbi:MAG: LysR family transcriptional regulator [Ectothiorhodospiraceae bacterium]|nr:LysR family transcriptional regulator [Ectothiorhodospiraceae bacterium]